VLAKQKKHPCCSRAQAHDLVDMLQKKRKGNSTYLLPCAVWPMKMGRKNLLRHLVKASVSRFVDSCDWCQSFHEATERLLNAIRGIPTYPLD